jgi:O-antigen/teichoic acid export membrane protein
MNGRSGPATSRGGLQQPLSGGEGIAGHRGRAILRDGALYGLGSVGSRLIAFLSLPLYTRLFEPADYGRLAVVIALVGLVSPLLALGSDTVYARFWFAVRDDASRRTVSSTWLLALSVWSTAVVLASLPLTPLIARALTGRESDATVVGLALASVPVALLNRMCAQSLRNRFRPAAYVTVTVLAALSTVAVGLGLATSYGIAGAAAGLLLGELLLLPAHLWLARKVFTRRMSTSLLRQMLGFGLPLVPTSLSYWVFVSSDRLLIARLSDVEELGLFSVAAAIAALLGLAQFAIGQAWVPHITDMFETDDEGARALTAAAVGPVLATGCVLTVAVILLAPQIVDVVAAPSYAGAVGLIWPLALGQLAFLVVPIVSSGMTLKRRTRTLALHSAIAAGLNVSLNLILIPGNGGLGAAYATAASYGYLAIAYAVAAQRLWRVPYPMARLTVAAVLSVVFVLTAAVLAPQTGVAGAALKAILLLLSICVMGWLRLWPLPASFAATGRWHR